MKKAIALFLALCICLGMSACKKEQTPEVIPENKTEIVGEWLAVNVGASAVFNADGTGELSLDGTNAITWKYDAAAGCYIISDTITHNAFYGMEYDMEYLSIGNVDFYRPDDYDRASALLLTKRYEDIFDFTADMIEIDADTIYTLAEGIGVEFTEIYREAESEKLIASYVVTNYRDDTSENLLPESISVELNGRCYLAGSATATNFSGTLEFTTKISPGESFMGTVTLCTLENQIQPTLNSFGSVIGAVYFKLNDQYVFVNISEYYK